MAPKRCLNAFLTYAKQISIQPTLWNWHVYYIVCMYISYYDNIYTYAGMATASAPMDPTPISASGSVKNEDTTLLNCVFWTYTLDKFERNTIYIYIYVCVCYSNADIWYMMLILFAIQNL